MDRYEAIARLSTLEGRDLRTIADENGVTVWKDNGGLTRVGLGIR